MNTQVSAVINTYNEEKNIQRAINSVKALVDEVIVCDMYSTDKTVELAKKLGAKVIFHKLTHFVEPARNFALSKASGDWVLLLDADEEITQSALKKLQEITALNDEISFVELPRKNIIFGKWMKATMWWPDYHIRFFKKGTVVWDNHIHSKPQTTGLGVKLESQEDLSIIHHHYQTTAQFIERMNRYTSIQAEELKEKEYKFIWSDLVSKPLGEFLSRFFAHRGFEDGLHGLALSLLQSFSILVVYLKVWEIKGFEEKSIELKEIENLSKKSGNEINYWFKYGNLSKNLLKNILQRAKNKII